MSEKRSRFEALYQQIILEEKGMMNEKLSQLFDELLVEEFDNDPSRMSEFIQSIVDEHTEHEPTEIEKLQAGLAQASFQQMQANKKIEELTKQNAAMGFKMMQLEQNQHSESEVG